MIKNWADGSAYGFQDTLLDASFFPLGNNGSIAVLAVGFRCMGSKATSHQGGGDPKEAHLLGRPEKSISIGK